MAKKIGKLLYWVPRVLSIIYILLLALFSLDIFDMGLGFWGTILGLFIHNIPSLMLLIVVAMSWNREIIGGIAFILFGIFITVSNWKNWIAIAVVASPAMLTGVLFLINWNLKKKKKKQR